MWGNHFRIKVNASLWSYFKNSSMRNDFSCIKNDVLYIICQVRWIRNDGRYTSNDFA